MTGLPVTWQLLLGTLGDKNGHQGGRKEARKREGGREGGMKRENNPMSAQSKMEI